VAGGWSIIHSSELTLSLSNPGGGGDRWGTGEIQKAHTILIENLEDLSIDVRMILKQIFEK
jgi:hypothetical protein